MKLVRFGPRGEERPGVLMEKDSKILDVRAMAFDIEDFNGHFLTHWGIQRIQALLKEPSLKTVPADGVRLGPPVARPGKIVCLGKNYADHAAEFDAEIPSSPILFSKAPTSLVGPFDPIVLPRGANIVDGEVELAVVIGKTACRVSESDALQFIAGYTVLNDVTDREAQKEGKLPRKLALPELVEAALAKSVLSKDEADKLLAADALRYEAIQVDNFAPGELEGLSQQNPVVHAA